MSDQVVTVTVKGIGDFSDVVSNVGSVQKALTKLKLPDKLGDNLNKNITAFYKEYEKYQQKIAGGLKTQGDYNQVEKSLNTMRSLYQAIGADAQKLLKLDMKDLLKLDTGEFKKISDDITNIMKEIGSFKIDMSPFTKATAEIRNVTKNSKISGDNGLLNQIIGSINTGQIAEAKKQLQELQNYANRVAPRQTASGDRMPGTLSPEKYQQLTSAIGVMTGAVGQAEAAMNPLIQRQNDLQRELEETKQKAASGIEKEFKGYNEASKDVERVTDSLKKMHQEEFSFNREAQNIDRQIQSYFGLSQMIRKVGDIARDAFSTVKELDKAMTETAVVTNFSVGDMWEMLPTYTAQANQLGSTIKDVYDAATLYYQQGLNTNQAMSLANETLKMARIAGLDAADATNMMTAALRGFNMEINQQSAQKINDIYSELAAITASDTKEIGSAMERTASIANSANMEFATTSAFLAQMIETTREAPENLGTAMKTIVARFQEMKQDPTKLIDSEGVAMDANKVDKALKTIGVNLMNTKGEFRDLDDVFLDIASRWDTLSQGQQRYIATIAAGSRQQSRFIAMMSNYERTMELVDAANNSAGASQRQFEKTLDSMEAKLNKLKNAWDQFTMGLMNNQILKTGVDALTTGFTIVNKFVDAIGKLSPKPFEGITKSVLTLVTTLGMLNFGKKASRGLVMGGVGWWKGETSLAGGFASGWKSSGQTGLFGQKGQANRQGQTDGAAYARGFQQGALKINLKANGFLGTIKSAYTQMGKQAIGWDTIQANKMAASSPIRDMVDKLLPEDAISAEATNQLQKAIDEAGGNVRLGVSNYKKQTGKGKFFTNKEAEELQTQYDEIQAKIGKGGGLEEGANKAEQFGISIANAGQSLQMFGSLLEGTPLAPFGNLLSSVGSLLMGFGSTIGWVGTTWAASVEAAGGATLSATAMMKAGITGVTEALMASPIFWIAAAILAVVAAVKVADWAIETNAEKLEKAEDAAAAASEAYDSAKQETSELADSIAKIQETDSAFDNLVAGTAEFNEQLVTANEQILALIDKYPMLMEGGYVSTDKNGLMHISDEGFKAVKEYQKQIQANASAMNLIQTADLNALENMQKAEALRTKVNGSRRGEMTESEAREHEKNLRDADLLEQRAKAEVDLARSNAIRTALSGKELRDTEALTAVYTNLYDEKRKAAETEVNALGAHDIRQRYADYHGYTYDRSTKKIKDIEGNEIDYDDKALKDEVIEQTVLLDFEENASSLDDVLTSVNNKFKQGLKGDFGDASKFISDVLSSNIDTNQDLLQEVINNPKQLQELANSLTEKEIAAVLGVSESEVSSNVEQYKKEFESKILDNAKNISAANADANGKLAAMIAQSQGKTAGETFVNKTLQSGLIAQVEKLSSQQRNTLLKVGEILQSSVGADSMSTFIKGMTDIYDTEQEQLINTAQDWADGINWESAIDRLRGYNEAINMTTENTEHLGEAGVTQMNNLGKAMLQSTDEANLLGQAFEEFYNSSDWQEMSENMDKFVDSNGQLNAAAVMDMADECHSLNNLLDSGAISAGGVAAALNALGSDGDLVLSDLNAHVLELLSTFGQLDDIIASSHRNIENFDWGIDTGEAEDFVKESAEKWNELYKNGEYGNPQLEAYAKWIMGEEKYTSLLADKHGDLEATMAEVSKSVNLYSDGFEKAWDKLAQGSWENVNFSDDLKDLGISVSFDKNGDWNFDPGKATTEQLQQWLQQALQIGPEMAQAMIEDWSNYSPDFRAERQKNDFNAGLESYVKERTGADGGVAITTSELQTIASATGQTLDEVRSAIVDTAGISESQLHELENINSNTGEYIMDGAELNRQLSTAEGLKGQNSWLAQYKYNDTEGTVDIGSAMAAAVERGYTAAQAKQMAYESYTNAQQQGKDYYYKDQLLKADEFKSFDEFAARLEEIDQNQQWATIGQTMADAFIARLDQHDKEEEQKDKDPSLNRTQDNKPEPASREKEVSSLSTSERDKQSADRSREIQQGIADKTANFIKGLFTESSRGEEARAQKNGDNAQRASEKTQTAANETSSAATETSAAASETSGAATDLNTAATNLNNAATALNNAALKMTTTSEQPVSSGTSASTQTSVAPTIQTGGEIVQKVVTEAIGTEEVQAKIQQVKDTANEGANLTVGAIVDKSVQAAQTAVQGLQNVASKSTNTKVGATVGGNKEASNLNATIGKLQNKTVTVSVRINGESKIASLKNEISSLHDKSVTITTYKRTIKTGDTDATGRNNVIKHYSLPTLGSLAKGTRYGRLGPKGKGGLTLTGEKGYEIAWIPSESRSMILGAEGPQMINLPSDAVVYTHEQSKDILKKKQTIDAGSHSKRKRGGSGGSGGSGGGSGGSGGGSGSSGGRNQTKKSQPKLTSETAALSNVIVWWENIARRAESIQRKADKNQKAYEKYLKDIQATLKTTGTTGQGNAFIKNTNSAIARYTDELNRATAELKNMDQGTKAQQKSWKTTKNKTDNITATRAAFNAEQGGAVQISYSSGSGKKKKNVNKIVSTAGYIKAQDGTYVIDQSRLNTVKNKEERKALADALNKEINDRISKRNKAQDDIKKAQEALEKFGEELYNTFFAWENELTKIWNLTQKIEDLQARTSRSDAFDELLEAQLDTGFRTADSKTFNDDLNNFKQRLQAQDEIITARQEALKQSQTDLSRELNSQDTRDALAEVQKQLNSKNLSKTERLGYKQAQKELNKKLDAENKAREYSTITRRADGTIGISFDTQKFETDKLAGNISADMAKAIQDWVKKIEELNKNLNEQYKSLFSDVTQYYKDLDELQKAWADYEKELIDITENYEKERIDKLKELSDAIKKALDDLLDRVKKRLDERRRVEDNAKTEQDIAKKQQRLAALRADTSGGHQVEIAQLQQEIADAQQDYQRSLEDQLLDKLQEQGDEAARQRERQIELQEAIAETTNNIEQVTKWMANPKYYKEEIRTQFYANKKYDEVGPAGQAEIADEFEKFYEGLSTNQQKQTELKNSIESLTSALDILKQAIEKQNVTLEQAKDNKISFREAQQRFSGTSLEQLKNKGGYTLPDFQKGNATMQELHDAGFTAPELKAANYSAAELKEGGYTAQEVHDANYSFDEAKKANYSNAELIKAYGTSEALKAGYSGQTIQNINKDTLANIQKAINANKDNPEVSQTDLAGVKTNIDVNGKKTGGIVEGTVTTGGKYIYANSGSTLYGQAIDANTGKLTGKMSVTTIGGLTTKHFQGNKKEATEALVYAITHQGWGSKINKNFKALVGAAGIAGKQYKLGAKGHNWWATVGTDGLIYQNVGGGVAKWNPATGKTSLAKYNKASFLEIAKRNNGPSREYAQVLISKKAYSKEKLQQLGVKQFATGGLANYTGPAWLDGTPSKPELVLNATDTKNFMVLKDVLARAMGSTNEINNSYGGNATYEININVDHLNNDYDVDRVVERVKKKIVQDAGYRNVTQVRKFR